MHGYYRDHQFLVQSSSMGRDHATLRKLSHRGWAVTVFTPQGEQPQHHMCASLVEAAELIASTPADQVHVWSSGRGTYVDVDRAALGTLLDAARAHA